MEVHEAAELLLSTARYEMTEAENEAIANRLVQRLQCLPLAVAQAGAYIASSRRLDRYLELYEDTAQRIQLLNRKPVQSDYEWSVYTTWQISFKELSPRAAELLQLCSFIHHSGITEEIFRHAALYKFTAEEETQLKEPLKFLTNLLSSSSSKWDSLKFIALTTELGGYSLIEFEAGSGAITFSIHPLVHEWCRTTLESKASTELCMQKLVGMSLSATDEFRFGHLVFPHLDALLFKGTEDSAREPNILDLAFAEVYLRIYDEEGRWSDGVKLGNSVLQMATPELQERKVLRIRRWLARMYRGHGHFDEAKILGEQVLSRLTELVGEHDPDTLTSMGNLALAYSDLGLFKKAEALQHTVLNKMREIRGDNHPDTVWPMANLARTYSDLGQLKEAEELEARVLNKCREILGQNHPHPPSHG
ncbi:hypothetical protein B0H17DRAFT_1338801 [Mycena rosella]|uniref:DUF7779 domain-containing protein n=1 Tax=Mycena rosella TaxID=1033263 RepID=A0AAD7CH68_MYCRO|nr:hypothetical protein B0H17DRAFT_1338801 [Mycena rosella]